MRRELYDALLALFETPIVNSREGYWLHQQEVTTTAAVGYYRMPVRAIVNNPERIELRTAAGSHYRQLIKAEPREITEYEGSGTPVAYTLRGDGFELLPTPDSAYTVRVHYYLRPSRLIAVMGSESGTPGLITAVDQSARTIAVDEVPQDELTQSAITSGSTLIDAVRSDGAHDVVMVDATQSLSGTTFTIGAGVDMSRVQVGDYVFARDQSSWPQLAQDYHRTLADAAASLILLAKGDTSKAKTIASKVQADLERLEDLLQPRPHDSRKRARPRHGVVWGRGRGRRMVRA